MLTPDALPDFTDADLAEEVLARAETIPSSWYTDPLFHRLDAETVFRDTWQAVGHTGQVAAAGQHFTAEVAGDPVLVVRGADGVLRGFYNVCRHRGGPLATEAGCSKVLQCKYHGWTYGLDGSLRGVPQFDRVELFDRKDYGLIPVQVTEWNGLVLVNLHESPEPIGDLLAGIEERIAPLDLGALTFEHRVDYDLRCNWKVYVDNFLEGYHVPFVHPELCKLYDFQRYTTEVMDRYSLQWSPLTQEENVYSRGGGTAFYYYVFPSLMLNILPGRTQSNLIVPTGPNSCRVVFQYFYEDVTTAPARQRIADDIAFSHEVQLEDVRICEHVQRGLESRAYDRGRFSVQMEPAVHHFQRMLKARYRAWRDARLAAAGYVG